MQFLGENEIPFCIIFTKSDKINSSKLNQNLQNYQTELLKTWEEMPQYFITSATEKSGQEELLNFIHDINQNLELK